GASAQRGEASRTEGGELDEQVLACVVEPESRLHLGDLGSPRPLVRPAESLAVPKDVDLECDQVAPFIPFAGLERGEGRAGCRFGLDGARTLRLGGAKLVLSVLDGYRPQGGVMVDGRQASL